MVSKKDSNKARLKRRKRVRAKISGTAACPRLSVYRSLNHIYAQLVDDANGVTLAAAATVEKEFEYGGNKEAATKVGELLAKRAAEKGKFRLRSGLSRKVRRRRTNRYVFGSDGSERLSQGQDLRRFRHRNHRHRHLEG